MAGMRSSGTWGSALTSGEFAAIRSAGFEPVGQVFGAAVFAASAASGYGCPGVSGSSGGGTPGRAVTQVSGRGGSFGPLVEAMYQARDVAFARMSAECAELGGHGVVGVRVSRGSFLLGGVEFTAIGTAVRAAGAALGPGLSFTSDVSGQDFAKLIMAGWVPAGLALGVSIGLRHDDRGTVRQARWSSGNAEIAGWTELVSESRNDARRLLQSDVERLGAEGVVVAAMQVRMRERDCPVQVGRRDHIVEAALIGTAIARFSRAGRRPAWPALAVMSLDPQRRQAARIRILGLACRFGCRGQAGGTGLLLRRPTYWMRVAWISPASMAACSSASLVSARSEKKKGP
jgi:uncharacterized protein YbjQ (UPF0145 family)